MASPQTLVFFFWGERDLRHFHRIGFELPISIFRPTNYIMTGLRVAVYYEARNDYTNDSETILCVTDVRVIWKISPND